MSAIARRMFRPTPRLELLPLPFAPSRWRTDSEVRRPPARELEHPDRRRAFQTRAALHSLFYAGLNHASLWQLLHDPARVRFAWLRPEPHWRVRFEFAGRDWRRARTGGAS